MTVPADFLASFESGTIDPDAFGHEDHVRAAFLLLQEVPLSAAVGRYAAALRRLTAKAGRPEAYHETITVAFLIAIADRMADSRHEDWAGFRRVNADLLDRNWLAGVYGRAELAAEGARQGFRLPRAPRARRNAAQVWLCGIRTGFAALLLIAAIHTLSDLTSPAAPPPPGLAAALAVTQLLGASLFLFARARLAGAVVLIGVFVAAALVHGAGGDLRLALPLHALAVAAFVLAERVIREFRPKFP